MYSWKATKPSWRSHSQNSRFEGVSTGSSSVQCFIKTLGVGLERALTILAHQTKLGEIKSVLKVVGSVQSDFNTSLSSLNSHWSEKKGMKDHK